MATSRAIAAVSSLAFLVVALPPFSSLMGMARESCAISGRVVDETGKPIPFAVVNALRGQFLRAEFVAAGSAADQRGEYCLGELPLGDYLVRATARMHPPSASPLCDSCCRPTTEFETTFYRAPHAPGPASPVSVVKHGNRSTVDIQMRRVPAYCVRGEVRDITGSLVSQAAIAIEQGTWSAGVLSEGGRFLLTSLPPGAYTILVRDRPQFGRVLARRIVNVRAANVDGLVIAVGPSLQSPSPPAR